MEELLTAAELHARYALDDDGLAELELFVEGRWRRFTAIDTLRCEDPPVLLYTDFPDGEIRLPRQARIPVRSVQELS